MKRQKSCVTATHAIFHYKAHLKVFIAVCFEQAMSESQKGSLVFQVTTWTRRKLSLELRLQSPKSYQISCSSETIVVKFTSNCHNERVKHKASQEDPATKKKAPHDIDGQKEDPSTAANMSALQEQEDQLIKKVKLAMRETVKDMLCGKTETLKIESLNEAVTKLQDIIQQAEVGKTLQGTLSATTADM